MGRFFCWFPGLFLTGFFPGQGVAEISDGAPKIASQAPDPPGPKQDDDDYQDNKQLGWTQMDWHVASKRKWS